MSTTKWTSGARVVVLVTPRPHTHDVSTYKITLVSGGSEQADADEVELAGEWMDFGTRDSTGYHLVLRIRQSQVMRVERLAS